MPLMRLKCTQCKHMFEQTNRAQRRCLACRTPQMRYRNEIARLRKRIAELESQRHEESWHAWLERQLEPFFGDRRLNDILMHLLGRVPEPEKVEA